MRHRLERRRFIRSTAAAATAMGSIAGSMARRRRRRRRDEKSTADRVADGNLYRDTSPDFEYRAYIFLFRRVYLFEGLEK
jgi:hypothetical protein